MVPDPHASEPTPMPRQLEDLVLDVQLNIVSQFLDKPELLLLATVSRHCNRIVAPLIYRCISLRLPISQVATPQRDDNDALQAAQRTLVNTFTARPELARHTQTLEWQIQPMGMGKLTGYESLLCSR